jgi:hypothetical protein
MTLSTTPSAEARSLLETLEDLHVAKKQVSEGFAEFSQAAKDEVIEHVARTFSPAPAGRLLARLMFVRSPDSQRALERALLANLRSDDAEARKFALYGLQELKYANLEDIALLSLRDESDAVTAAAAQILLPAAKSDSDLRALLTSFYEARRADGSFHATTSILSAASITARDS